MGMVEYLQATCQSGGEEDFGDFEQAGRFLEKDRGDFGKDSRKKEGKKSAFQRQNWEREGFGFFENFFWLRVCDQRGVQTGQICRAQDKYVGNPRSDGLVVELGFWGQLSQIFGEGEASDEQGCEQ